MQELNSVIAHVPFLKKPLKNVRQTTQMGWGKQQKKERQPQDAVVQRKAHSRQEDIGFSRKEKTKTKRTPVSAPVELVIGECVAER